ERHAIAAPGGEVEDAVAARIDAGEEGRPVRQGGRRLHALEPRPRAARHQRVKGGQALGAEGLDDIDVGAVEADDDRARAHDALRSRPSQPLGTSTPIKRRIVGPTSWIERPVSSPRAPTPRPAATKTPSQSWLAPSGRRSSSRSKSE